MGLPLNKLICSSNENNALTKFFETGNFDIENMTFRTTISPSIDILKPNNLERLLYLITEDPKLIKELYNEFEKTKKFSIDEKILNVIKDNFYYEYCLENECRDTIKNVCQNYGYIIDPHTSIAFNCYEKLCKKYNNLSSEVTVITATAHPFKFITTMLEIFGFEKGKIESFLDYVIKLNEKNESFNLNYKNFIHQDFYDIIKKSSIIDKFVFDSNLEKLMNFINGRINL